MTKKTEQAGKVVVLKKSKCPTCGKPATDKYHPFCSDRCAILDLGHWLDGAYRIPADEAPREDAFTAVEEDGEERG